MVKGRGHRSGSKVEVKGQCQGQKCGTYSSWQSHQLSADFSGTEREKEEKEHGETIKGPTP